MAQRLFEAAELERLDQVIHHAVVQRLLHRVHIAGGRDDDHIGLLAQFAQAGQQIQPVLLLHVDIQQHQIDADAGVGQQGARLAQSGDRRLAVKTADLAQVVFVQLCHHRVVVDNQYVNHGFCSWPDREGARKIGSARPVQIRNRCCPQFLQMAADQRQANAASRSLGRKSVFEDARADRRIDAGAVVADDTV